MWTWGRGPCGCPSVPTTTSIPLFSWNCATNFIVHGAPTEHGLFDLKCIGLESCPGDGYSRPSLLRLYRSGNSARWLSGSLCKSLCSGSYSVDNMLIASTATDITGQCTADLFLAG